MDAGLSPINGQCAGGLAADARESINARRASSGGEGGEDAFAGGGDVATDGSSIGPKGSAERAGASIGEMEMHDMRRVQRSAGCRRRYEQKFMRLQGHSRSRTAPSPPSQTTKKLEQTSKAKARQTGCKRTPSGFWTRRHGAYTGGKGCTGSRLTLAVLAPKRQHQHQQQEATLRGGMR